MANSFFVVQANAVAGQDAELNRWYDEQHLGDCLACATAVSAQRFRKVPGTGPGAYSYLALYEVADPQIFAEDRRSKEGTPLLLRTAALDLPAHAFFYRPPHGQSRLLTRPGRRSLYIEYLDAVASGEVVDLMPERQRFLESMPDFGDSEVMMVDAFQERQGWHAGGIIFTELLDHLDEDWRPDVAAPNGCQLKVVEAGLYRPISPQRIRA